VYFLRVSANSCMAEGGITKVSPVATNVSAGPDVAYSGSSYGAYGVTWWYQDASTLKTYLMFSRVDQNSAKVAGSDLTITEITGGADSPHARVDWNTSNNQYGISFLQGDVKIAFARVSSSGAMVGSPIVYANDSQSVNSSGDTSIAAAGTTWGLAWTESSNFGHFMRIDNTGTKASPVLAIGGYAPSLASNGSDFLYIYFGPSSPYTVLSSHVTCP
jgi:hypothetical protein